MPQVIEYGGIATLPDGTSIDLRISNVTAYDAFKASNNGVKVASNGTFGVINLLAPRSAEVDATFVQLRFSFLNASNGAPLTLRRTHMTFYDFDQTWRHVRECMQAKGGIVGVALAEPTELEQIESNSTTMQQILSAQPEGTDAWAGDGATEVLCSTVTGIGDDNPTGPRSLDALQRSRSVMLHFESVASFDVRVSLSGDTGTGRNFLFAGFSNVGDPL